MFAELACRIEVAAPDFLEGLSNRLYAVVLFRLPPAL